MGRFIARATARLCATALIAGGAFAVTVAGADPAAAATDTAAPTVTSYRVLPPSVNVTTGGASATIVLRVHDTDGAGHDGTGLDHGSVTLGNGSVSLPAITFTGADRTSGTVVDCTYDLHVDLPQGQAGGSYTASITLVDAQSNTATTNNTSAPLAVTRTPDTAPPARPAPVTATPAAVDVTTGGKDVTYAVTLTDNVSGVADATLTLHAPDGSTEDLPLDHTSGTLLNGGWSATRPFGVFDTPGSWTVTKLVAHDNYGNALTQTSSLGGGETVSRTDDTTPPVITSATPTPSSVNTTSGPATVTVAVHATDDLSGVSSGDVQYTNGADTVFGSFAGPPDAGTPTNGTWNVSIDVPTRSTAGTWTLTIADVTDVQGQSTSYDGSDPSTAPPVSHFGVVTAADASQPALSSFAIGPPRVSTTYTGAAELHGVIAFTDTGSGLQQAELSFARNGTVDPTQNLVVDITALTSGTAFNGTLGFADSIFGAAPGNWSVASVALTDVAGNVRTVAAAALGTHAAFVVTASTGDTTAPTLSAMSVSPAAVNTTTGDKTVTVSASFTDPGTDPSGVQSVYGTLTSPSGGRLLNFSFDPTLGDPTSNTYGATVTVGKFEEAGVWHVSDLVLDDNAGNEAVLAQGDIAAAIGASAPTLTVTSATDTTAPTLTAVAVTTPTVNAAVGDPVVVHVAGTDNGGGSGLERIEVELGGPGGRTASGFDVIDPAAASGALDVGVGLPAYNSSGTWTVTGVTVIDVQGNQHAYSAADVAGFAGAHSSTVTGTPDTTVPAVSALTITPSPVDTSGGPVDADVTVHVTDAASGVASLLHLNASSPHGTQVLSTPLYLIAGTVNDGYYQGTLHFPKFVDPGTWTLTPLSVSDLAGNAHDYTAAELGSASSLSVTGPPDTTAPTVTGVSVTPASVDTSTGDQTVTFTVKATDAGSGVQDVRLDLASPSGATTDVLTLSPTPASTPANATYTAAYPLPAFSETGTWSVVDVFAADAYGNGAVRNHDQLSGAGFVNSFAVTGTADVTGPTLTSLTISPNTVDVSAGAVTLHGSLVASDSQSGVSYGSLSYTGPGGTVLTADVDVSQRTAGTANNATMPVSVIARQYLPGGTYTLTSVDLTDARGNPTHYGAANLPSSGVTTTISVTDTNPDTAAPTVTSATPTPANLDVHAASGSETIDVAITDAGSGFADATLAVSSPTHLSDKTVGFDTTYRVSGDAHNGVYRVSVPFAPDVEPGTWTVSLTFIEDAAGNGSGSAAVPGTPHFTVQSTPTAPATVTGVSATGGNGTATVGWNRPYSGGSAITKYVVVPTKNGTPQAGVEAPAGATNTVISGLTNGASYTFTVTAVNAVGSAPASNPSNAVVPAPTAPGAPSGASAVAGNAGATVSWTAPTDNGGSPVTGYLVSTFTSSGFPVRTDSLGNVLSTPITGLTNGVAYYFEVQAVNAAGTGAGTDTGLVTPTNATPPGAPTIGTATFVSPTSATVTWTAPASTGGAPVTGYTVTPFVGATAQAPTTVGAVTSTTVTGLGKGVSYTFRVAATNTAGTGAQSAASNTVAVPATVPGAASAVNAVLSGSMGAVVSWTAPADNGGTAITGYTVTSSPGGLTCTSSASTVCTVSGLTKGTSYTFSVVATNAKGSGPASAASNVMTVPTTAPGAPTGVTAATVAGTTGLTVSWTPPADTGGSAITGYAVTGAPGGSCSTTGTTSCTVTGLTRGQAYSFTVKATNANGTGPASAASSAVTVPTSKPGAPTGVAAALNGPLAATLSWTAPADNGGTAITGYTVTSSPGGLTCTTATTGCTVSGLAKGTAYTFTVTAANSVGTGPASAPSNSVTAPATAPGAPTGLTAGTGNGQATVSWTAPADTGGSPITGYTVTAAPGGATCTTSGATTCAVTGLTNGTAYTFTVTATNAVGPGAASAASTPAITPRAPTTLAITSSSTSVAYGKAAVVAGKLTRTDSGAAAPGVTVRLQYRRKGSTAAFATFATSAVSSSTGAVAFRTFKPPYNVEIRLLTSTGGAYTGAVSARRTIAVSRVISSRVSVTSLRHGGTFTFSGSVSPRTTGRTIVLQRRSGTRWVTILTGRTSSTSTYAFRVRTTSIGTFTYRASMAADTAYLATTSTARAVRVS